MFRTKAQAYGAIAAIVIIGFAAAPLLAHHQWSTYQWESDRTAPISPAVVDNTGARWTEHVAIATDDWNASPWIESPLESGNNSSCAMVTGTIQVCNSDYGSNGWLGLATIALRSGIIVGGSTKLNDYYFNQARYNTFTRRQLVTCQEIGHTYGLTHQNEDFSTDLTTSCMEYTSNPEGNEGPDFHDYDQLAAMYGSGGASDGGGSTPGGGKGGKGGGGGKGKNRVALPAVGNTPASWGEPTQFLPNGKPVKFEKTYGNYKFVTHVTWADEGENHH